MELDLSGILTPEALKRLAKKEKKGKAVKAVLVSPPKPKASPWEAVAAILVETVVVCTCGTHWSIPNEEPLVRFRHKRRGDLWEVAQHPTLLKPNLPKETRQLFGTCRVCPNCWENTEILEVELDQETHH